MILVTGGAGFIGSNFIFDWLAAESEPVVNLDKLTYLDNMPWVQNVTSGGYRQWVDLNYGERGPA